jgi:hypothetical protein
MASVPPTTSQTIKQNLHVPGMLLLGGGLGCVLICASLMGPSVLRNGIRILPHPTAGEVKSNWTIIAAVTLGAGLLTAMVRSFYVHISNDMDAPSRPPGAERRDSWWFVVAAAMTALSVIVAANLDRYTDVEGGLAYDWSYFNRMLAAGVPLTVAGAVLTGLGMYFYRQRNKPREVEHQLPGERGSVNHSHL